MIGWLTDSVSCNGPKGFASGVLGILGAQTSFPGKSTFLVKQTFLVHEKDGLITGKPGIHFRYYVERAQNATLGHDINLRIEVINKTSFFSEKSYIVVL